MLSCEFNFLVVVYLSCRRICIFELATSCGHRTISFLYYSKARVTNRAYSRCRYRGLQRHNGNLLLRPPVNFNLLGNKGPKATYKSQNPIYNDYSPRHCIQYIKNTCGTPQYCSTRCNAHDLDLWQWLFSLRDLLLVNVHKWWLIVSWFTTQKSDTRMACYNFDILQPILVIFRK